MTLLSRTAENLFWIGRYVERAENMARLLETGKRMSAIPRDSKLQPEWEPILAAAGVQKIFGQHYDIIDQGKVVDFIAFSRDNPSSIVSSIKQARENARSIRTALTIDMWEALNGFWLELRETRPITPGEGRLLPFLDWVKRECALFRGVLDSTILRDDSYNFLRLGTYIERADCTARILDVKYYALLPPQESVSGGVDTYQWSVILRATSSLRSYNWVYRGGYEASKIAEFLILNTHSARSLAYCIEKIGDHLARLAQLYDERRQCHDICNTLHAYLSEKRIETIFEDGLHEFLMSFVIQNNALSAQIAADYNFISARALDTSTPVQQDNAPSKSMAQSQVQHPD